MFMQDWGEEELIHYLSAQFPSRNAIVGIGDDCAVIPLENGRSQLITTDAMVEGVHFIREQISPSDLGYKTVAVSVSDIAAMGGVPEYGFLTLALPGATDTVWLKSVIEGIGQACSQWNLQLLGGDTVGSKRDIFLSFTLVGSAPNHQIRYRHHAMPGDILCVTGFLGDSGGGFRALQKQLPSTPEIQSLVRAHFHPQPSPEEGSWLATQEGVRAMMDVSDGLDCDLQRLINASQCGAIIEIESLPISDALSHVSRAHGWDAIQLALTGGEDYCLLVTVSSDVFDSVRRNFQAKFGHSLYPVGRVIGQQGRIVYHREGKPVDMQPRRYDHFHGASY